MAEQEQPRTVLRFWQHGAIFLLACAVIVSRRPDAVFHAQFYAEDGHVWFADAYNLGWWPALFRTYAGYFELLPRLGASLALLVPFCLVPLLLNLIAIAFQALPVNMLLAARSSTWGSLRFRLAAAGMYLALPNCDEVGRGITNAQWPLALSAFILLLACTPRGIAGRLFDSLFLLLCGLSGPFCIFLLPISFFLAMKQRDAWRWVYTGILAGACLIQAWALLILAPASRAHRAFGASPELFARILGGQVYIGALLGHNKLAATPGLSLSIVLTCAAIGGTAFAAVCFLKSPIAMKLFLLFSFAVLAGGLINPFEWDHPAVPIWQVYAYLGGLRYWFVPTLAFAWTLLWGYRSRIPAVKAVSVTLLCFMCFGIIRDWRHPSYSETHFSESVKRFDAAPAGATVTIPEHPQGWTMQLVKHPTKQ
jgi:hypothetical protein